jgi:hypothetical protein
VNGDSAGVLAKSTALGLDRAGFARAGRLAFAFVRAAEALRFLLARCISPSVVRFANVQ